MNNNIYTKVFTWLFIGLLVTFALGYGFSLAIENNPQIAMTIFSGVGFWIIIILQFALAIFMGARLTKLSPTTTKLLYIAYTALTGITFSAVFLLFKISSISIIFLVSALIFGIFAYVGSKLNVDLSKFGTYLLIALIATIVVSIINIFIGSDTFSMFISGISILIFTLYIGYDIKCVEQLVNTDIDEDSIAIYAAFQLYLDFINIFIRLLELFGQSRD